MTDLISIQKIAGWEKFNNQLCEVQQEPTQAIDLDTTLFRLQLLSEFPLDLFAVWSPAWLFRFYPLLALSNQILYGIFSRMIPKFGRQRRRHQPKAATMAPITATCRRAHYPKARIELVAKLRISRKLSELSKQLSASEYGRMWSQPCRSAANIPTRPPTHCLLRRASERS